VEIACAHRNVCPRVEARLLLKGILSRKSGDSRRSASIHKSRHLAGRYLVLYPSLARQEASFSNCSNSHLAFEQDFSHTWQRPYTAYMDSNRESVSGVDSDPAQYLVVVEFQLRPEAVSRNPWRGEVPQEGAREAAIALNCRLSFILMLLFYLRRRLCDRVVSRQVACVSETE